MRAGWTYTTIKSYKKYPKMNMKISKIIAEKIINIPVVILNERVNNNFWNRRPF